MMRSKDEIEAELAAEHDHLWFLADTERDVTETLIRIDVLNWALSGEEADPQTDPPEQSENASEEPPAGVWGTIRTGLGWIVGMPAAEAALDVAENPPKLPEPDETGLIPMSALRSVQTDSQSR